MKLPNKPADGCVFCAIAEGSMPATIVHEDEDVLAFPDVHPKYPVHVLIIPRRHIPSVAALTADDDAIVGKLLRTGAAVARKLGIEKSGFRLLTNTGQHAGQVVDHLHVHLLGGESLHPL